MVKAHEQTIEEHVKGSVSQALDQLHEYESLAAARDAYLQNVCDSCEEDGYTPEEAFDAGNWFIVEFSKKTGIE